MNKKVTILSIDGRGICGILPGVIPACIEEKKVQRTILSTRNKGIRLWALIADFLLLRLPYKNKV
ncbi:MAG: hypothetical protein A2W90_09690 [Bacteroidetes bacterium GWF2_42_66]|nr:MAG: hypothetical protein A2W92_05310 [Bacteroidetes bacterium GWA2_42_15]OFX97563.1 MAG: hypothetical protein A2W89_01715 [Bacteroidetes bacterium GWE2_42_39]OFY43742.1 MAG: hypothetical protein A2W90_09690 [Bacteroidetes bacterium GWF2_42_66]HBL76282.1 hypothetical protein [Prolixibacteraceae bacterium]HCU60520.1 hypothetical protein [Prolixibacteraceae bacterium]